MQVSPGILALPSRYWVTSTLLPGHSSEALINVNQLQVPEANGFRDGRYHLILKPIALSITLDYFVGTDQGGSGVLTETGHIMFVRPSQLVAVVPLTTSFENIGNTRVGGSDEPSSDLAREGVHYEMSFEAVLGFSSQPSSMNTIWRRRFGW